MQAHLIKWIQIGSDAVKPLEEETSPHAPTGHGNDPESQDPVPQGQSEETQAIEESLQDFDLSRPGPDPELLPEGLLPSETTLPTTNGCGIDLRWLGLAENCSQYDEAAGTPTIAQTRSDKQPQEQVDGAARMSSTGCNGLQHSTNTVHRCSQYVETAKSLAGASLADILNVRQCSQYGEAADAPTSSQERVDDAARMSSTGFEHRVSGLQNSADIVQECSQYDEAAVRLTVTAQECSQFGEVGPAPTTAQVLRLEARKHSASVAQVSSTGFEGRDLPGCSQYDEAIHAPEATLLCNRVVAHSAAQESSAGFEGCQLQCATASVPRVTNLKGLTQPGQQMSSTGFEGSNNTFIDHRDLPALRRAKAKLVIKLRDKTSSLFLRGRLTSMVALINLYLDHQLGLKWIAASKVAAKAAGKGDWLARSLRRWVILFMNYGVYPVRKQRNDGIPSSEDLDQLIHLHLLELNKAGHVRAQDIIDFLETPAMRAHLGTNKGFKIRAAHRWMERMDWRYGAPKNGMYKDGHEDPEVIAYRKAFCERWTNDYATRMWIYNNDGSKISDPKTVDLRSGRYPLILVTHDESTFYANDRRKTRWHHPDAIAPQPKGEGQSIMVSDFLTPDWGRLKHGDE